MKLSGYKMIKISFQSHYISGVLKYSSRFEILFSLYIVLKLSFISSKFCNISANSLLSRSSSFDTLAKSSSIIAWRLLIFKNSSGIFISCINSQVCSLIGKHTKSKLFLCFRILGKSSRRIVRNVLNRGLYSTSFLTRRGSYVRITALF